MNTRKRTAVVLAGFAVVAGLAGCGAVPSVDPVVSTFKDTAGRVCTQVTYGGGIALDCDYPPIESRAGNALDDLLKALPTPTPSNT